MVFDFNLNYTPRNIQTLFHMSISLIGLLLTWIYYVETELASHEPREYILNLFNSLFVTFFLYAAFTHMSVE
jgi:hypothetical protein